MANDTARGTLPATPWWGGLSRKNAVITATGTLLAAIVAVALLVLPALWYVGAVGAGVAWHHEIVADLAELSALDARWEREAWRMLNDFTPLPAADIAAPLAGASRRLEAAARETGSPVLLRGVPEMVRAFNAKAERMQRFEKSHNASRGALREALAMEAEFAGLLREAWRDAPDRQRLVAADNVVTQLFADMQRYYFTPADTLRKNLETSTADLRSSAETLPATLKPAIARLEGHVAELLRARPQEQTDFDRVRLHDAGPRADMLIRELRREFDQNTLERERHGVYAIVYLCILVVLIAYLAARLVRRELAVRERLERITDTAGGEALPVEPTLPPPKIPSDP